MVKWHITESTRFRFALSKLPTLRYSNFLYSQNAIHHHFIELDKIINKKGNYMQIIASINQKGGLVKTPVP